MRERPLAELAALTGPLWSRRALAACRRNAWNRCAPCSVNAPTTSRPWPKASAPCLFLRRSLNTPEKDAAKHLAEAGKAHLTALAAVFAACDPFTAENLEAALNAYVADNGLKFKEVAPPLRTALIVLGPART